MRAYTPIHVALLGGPFDGDGGTVEDGDHPCTLWVIACEGARCGIAGLVQVVTRHDGVSHWSMDPIPGAVRYLRAPNGADGTVLYVYDGLAVRGGLTAFERAPLVAA